MLLVRPRISVIVPLYNSEKYLRQCLDSILGQTFSFFELILVDDGSTDNTLNLCVEYAKKDGRVQVYQQKHSGPGQARNTGMRLATGRYLSFLDSDDFFESTMFEKLYHSAEKTESDIIFYLYSKFDDRLNRHIRIIPNEELGQLKNSSLFNPLDFSKSLFQFSGSEAWKYFFRSDFIKKYDLKFANTLCGEDITFTMPARSLAKRIFFLNEVLVHYRIHHSDQLTHKSNVVAHLKKSYKITWKILKKFKLEKIYAESYQKRLKAVAIWLKNR